MRGVNLLQEPKDLLVIHSRNDLTTILMLEHVREGVVTTHVEHLDDVVERTAHQTDLLADSDRLDVAVADSHFERISSVHDLTMVVRLHAHGSYVGSLQVDAPLLGVVVVVVDSGQTPFYNIFELNF